MTHPGRVLAVYIHNVSREATRMKEIEELAKLVAAARSSLVLASDSVAIAEHAAKLGLISSASIRDVASERSAQERSSSRSAVQEVRHATPEKTAEAIAAGELHDAIESKPDGRPPNVVVEPGPHK